MRARSLSAVEARIILPLEEQGRDETSLEEIRRLGRVGPGYARKLAHDLAAKGWLQRLGRGRYLVNPSAYGPDVVSETDPLRIGSRLVHPYYFGYATAAELQGFLLQPGRVYYLASTARASLRTLRTAQFRVVHVDPGRFFGSTELRRRGELLSVSDPERTVLDCIDRPELAGGMTGAAQILARAKRQLSWARLDRYLRRLANRSLAVRVGFLAETIRPAVAPPRSFLTRWLPRGQEPWVPLGPPRTFGRRGVRDSRWRLVRNVPDPVLFAETETR